MYLKSVRALGFKSFADKIDIEIKKGITAIVGPNGSGKSNIVDAVRWVLGEQSLKSLRGSQMSDVIFSGSKTRSPHTRAYVALTFDNTDHYLNTEFQEVEIKRVAYHTGENEYYLNNSKVRLKDITDLFLDTGVGIDSFNIISQGSVANIISSKPEDRRTIFEDASGVLKYKKRKEISLKKLDKTKDNLASIKLVINELETSINPLKKQTETAQKYLSLKEELKTVEIALIASDIKEINLDYQKIKVEVEELENQLSTLNLKNTDEQVKLEKLKLDSLKLEEQINEQNNKYLRLTEELASLEAEKLVTSERQKYDKTANFKEALLKLKEEEIALAKDHDTLTLHLDNLKQELKEKQTKKDLLEAKKLKQKLEYEQSNSLLNDYQKEILAKENKIEILQENINNNQKVPLAVKSILSNNRLSGIHNIISSLIETQAEYLTAIDTALGYAGNFLVVDNEDRAKEAINYLKNNNLGRATFFPLNVIKERGISAQELAKVEKVNGFIAVASSLVKYDKIYANIIKNQLGNVLIVQDIDALNKIGHILDYKYRLVSLDGQILSPGGSLTGGSLNKTSSVVKDKLMLSSLEEEVSILKAKQQALKGKLVLLYQELQNINSENEELDKTIISLREKIEIKSQNKKNLEDELNQKALEIKGNQDLQTNKLDFKLIKILEEISEVSKEKEKTLIQINNLKSLKSDLSLEINELDSSYRKVNTKYSNLQNELNNKKILMNKYDLKLDNLLVQLSQDYNMTYEYASSNYELNLPTDLARSKVEAMKKEIESLGEVNTGAISEYNRLKERYDFLVKQSEDLELAHQELVDIINDMDKIMIDKFKSTFDDIAKEFNQVFKKLFQGGRGNLKLTNPNDILNTGIEIEAQPPGKKLNSINLLSGGEKTLTAIATLFAILNVKPSPFCILDEIEAALDEANVETFGKYLQEKKDKSQFILITHKKRTMEYADVLYGLTMQESGVSKLVSVDLQNG